MKPLTPRQTEIVSLLRQGLTPQEAARRLGVKYGTVRHQLQEARDRTGYRTTLQLVAAVKEDRLSLPGEDHQERKL